MQERPGGPPEALSETTILYLAQNFWRPSGAHEVENLSPGVPLHSTPGYIPAIPPGFIIRDACQYKQPLDDTYAYGQGPERN